MSKFWTAGLPVHVRIRNGPVTDFLFLTLVTPMYFLTFRGPCVVSIFLLIYFQQDATLHSLFISGKLLYMFRVFLYPSSGAYTTVFKVSGTCQTFNATCRSSNSSTIAAGSSNGLTCTRYCKYSCVCS